MRRILARLFKAPRATSTEKPEKTYPVGLVGESNYQRAISRCSVGQEVFLVREPDNEFDPKAIVCLNHRRETIGYISRDSFVQGVVHDQGLGCSAKIKGLRKSGDKGFVGVVIDLEITDEALPIVD